MAFSRKVWSVRTLAAGGMALLLAACSAQTEPVHVEPVAAQPAVPRDAAGIRPAPAGYTLTAEEAKLDCPRITGRMRVKIANMQAAVAAPGTSLASRTMQGAAAPIMGFSARGADPAADLARERAQLEAFNKRLAEKKCKTLDLDAELRGEAAGATSAKNSKAKG